ncbi:hypothetical protein [Egbenema bharatensis]
MQLLTFSLVIDRPPDCHLIPVRSAPSPAPSPKHPPTDRPTVNAST